MKKQMRQLFLIVYDGLAILLSFFLAFFVRFEFKVLFFDGFLEQYVVVLSRVIIAVLLIKLIILYAMRMYSSLWRYASIEEAFQIIFASAFATAGFMGYMLIMKEDLPRSIFILTFIFDTILFAFVRLSYRSLRAFKERRRFGVVAVKNVMIVGAGQSGAAIIKELKVHTELKSRPVAIIDDDETKIGQMMNGVPIVGSRYSIREYAQRLNIDQIIIAIPSADKTTIKEIVDEASKAHCELKIVPGMYELINGQVDVTTLRNVEIRDLLGREEVELDTDAMRQYVTGKVVMVTGGAGSIGSELCRQIAKYQPKQLIILDNYENSTYYLELELKQQYQTLNILSIIANIRDRARIFQVVEQYRPALIFHAAAHKHVPLMETSPCEAIKNNVFGTNNIIEAAGQFGVERFVMISTDKAVNPTNVMGASKRIAEMIIQSKHDSTTTKYVAVRFGNVLGSNGSVIPIFKKQIEQGGPVTVTHKDIERYFMTIPEACKLVIQASSFAEKSEIFVLDMGEPIKIVTLAENIIRLSGYKPYSDIAIEFTGLRPGEKMFEELILNHENVIKTANEKIFIERPERFSSQQIIDMLATLHEACANGGNIKAVLKEYIPTFNYLEDN